jgi:hypothetical protein
VLRIVKEGRIKQYIKTAIPSHFNSNIHQSTSTSPIKYLTPTSTIYKTNLHTNQVFYQTTPTHPASYFTPPLSRSHSPHSTPHPTKQNACRLPQHPQRLYDASRRPARPTASGQTNTHKLRLLNIQLRDAIRGHASADNGYGKEIDAKVDTRRYGAYCAKELN